LTLDPAATITDASIKELTDARSEGWGATHVPRRGLVRKLLWLAAIAIVALTFAACGGDDEGAAGAPAAPETGRSS
jgi:hypothetical protein